MIQIKIIQYKWAGKWGPFKIKIPCGECSLTEGIVKDLIEKEFQGVDISFEVLPWLDNWFSVLLRGGWHAPIVFVEKTLVGQGKLIDRGIIAAAIRKEIASRSEVPQNKNIFFVKKGCPFCQKAKELLNRKNIDYTYHDVIEDPLAGVLIIQFTKPQIKSNEPVTVPQIFFKGKYIGGYDKLLKHLNETDDKPKVCPIT